LVTFQFLASIHSLIDVLLEAIVSLLFLFFVNIYLFCLKVGGACFVNLTNIKLDYNETSPLINMKMRCVLFVSNSAGEGVLFYDL
jgi:hypothetical protein